MKRISCICLVLVILGSLFPFRAAAVTQPKLEVAGKSALLMDIATGTVLFESNPHEKLAPASVTKVMTMLLVMEAIDAGKIAMTDTVSTSEAAAAKGGSQIYLKVGETMSVADMLKSVAVSSANDCACALAEHIAGSEAAFVELMNKRAKELGMNDTNYANCTGLDDSEDAARHLTSAYDIAVVSRELMKNHPDIQKFTTIWMDTVRNGEFGLSNTNKLVRFYQGATGLKTGFTSGAGYCLSATAQRDGLGLIAVVMGCESSQLRFQSCKAMLDYGFANYALITPQLSGPVSVDVKLGKEETVTAQPGQIAPLLIDKGQKNSVTSEITLEQTVTAPVSKGQRLGTMTLRAGEQVLLQVPLLAEKAVHRLSFFDLWLYVLRKVCMG